ncbi:hypothetical protein GOP47_0025165 [Adiantum capillus-veneris]|uniref:Flavin-containing monooxygenase n=1 Tax=Adiantum capillus-veneris TaxID=13818 RepID=A0A9D4Z4B9_ADICA|nr:hypothetical protein GOP47_0025165 [Adiantum capillus-veneris]
MRHALKRRRFMSSTGASEHTIQTEQTRELHYPAMADVEVLIIGAGFSGLCMAIKLLQAGHTSFVLIDKHADVGGTWLLNRYPGCQCDVPSHLYSFSFDRNPCWTSMYADGREIHRYIKDSASRHGVLPHVRFNSVVVSTVWDDAAALWHVEIEQPPAVVSDSQPPAVNPPQMSGTSTITARFVVRAIGGLHIPNLPVIKGMEKFSGPAFHSSLWDSSISLEGKTVAVIGTGASSIQIVPEIAPIVKKLYVFQRSPPWIFPKLNSTIPLWCRQLFMQFPFLMCLFSWLLFLMQEVLGYLLLISKGTRKVAQRAALTHMHGIIEDPDMRQKLEPKYEIGCKRVLLSSSFYPALTRPNVELIADHILEMHENSILIGATGGQKMRSLHIDIIIYATGFDLFSPFRVVGTSGLEFNQEGYSSLLGTTKQGFPNFFTLLGYNTGAAYTSQLIGIEAQVRHTMSCLNLMRGPARSIEPHGASERRYQDFLARRIPGTVWTSKGCNSWYLDPNTGHLFSLWPGSTLEFIYMLWSAKPSDYCIK